MAPLVAVLLGSIVRTAGSFIAGGAAASTLEKAPEAAAGVQVAAGDEMTAAISTVVFLLIQLWSALKGAKAQIDKKKAEEEGSSRAG